MSVGLENIISYLETQLSTLPDLADRVFFIGSDEPEPRVRDYGVQIYVGSEKPKTIEPHKIGPWALETWTINVDFIYARDKKPRQGISDAKGISYWERTLTNLLGFKTNNGMFRDSRWESGAIEKRGGAVVLRGLFIVEVENIIGS